MIESDTNYRVLTPRATLAELSNLLVAPLPNGALCWVIADDGLWRLSKSSTAAVSATVIATGRGVGVPGRWVKFEPGGAAGANVLSSALSAPIDIDVAGPAVDFQAMHASLELALDAGFTNVTALLVINTGDNNSFGVGLRITYSLDGAIWTPLPGASMTDTDSAVNRKQISVMGTIEEPDAIAVRGEWTAFGDSGTWAIAEDETGSATITAWQS